MNILPKVKKGIASAMSKIEKVKKAVLGIAVVSALALGAVSAPDVQAASGMTSGQSPVLFQNMPSPDSQAGNHYSHSSHASHASHASHYSSRY